MVKYQKLSLLDEREVGLGSSVLQACRTCVCVNSLPSLHFSAARVSD